MKSLINNWDTNEKLSQITPFISHSLFQTKTYFHIFLNEIWIECKTGVKSLSKNGNFISLSLLIWYFYSNFQIIRNRNIIFDWNLGIHLGTTSIIYELLPENICKTFCLALFLIDMLYNILYNKKNNLIFGSNIIFWYISCRQNLSDVCVQWRLCSNCYFLYNIWFILWCDRCGRNITLGFSEAKAPIVLHYWLALLCGPTHYHFSGSISGSFLDSTLI